MCGVHFMAETAKILNPNKKVLISDMSAGCPTCRTITGEDVRLLKQKYPWSSVVSYVNTRRCKGRNRYMLYKFQRSRDS